MSAFYAIDSTRVSHREYWWGHPSPLVLFSWLFKWLRVRIPTSSDDANVESLTPFVVEALPAEVGARFAPATAELAGLGFLDPIFHVIYDSGTTTTIYWATFRHATGQHLARIHQRIWQQAKPPDRRLFVLFYTAFADGTFAGSSSGKPDFATPTTVPLLRRHRATPSALWAAHVEFSATQRQATVQPIRSREELLAATERLHLLLRDFHLARGVFRVRTDTEHASATAVTARFEEASATGFRHPAVLAEVERLQTQRPGWGNALVILVVSGIVFLAAGSAQTDWKFYLALIPLLFFHESGHWLAMKIFGYRNLRMFFIPLFGAAVTGQNWNVPGWKKALVSLAGPVPGILLGVALTVVQLISPREWLNQAAFLLLLVNGFNLLPVLPLDGGHVLHAILFCRNRWLDLAFRIAAIAGLTLLIIGTSDRFLIFIAIMMAIGLPVAFKLGKVTDTFRRTPIPPLLPGHDRIPFATADTIVSALKAELPANTNDKTLALHTVNVFETLNAHPPGWFATLGLLAVHGGSVLLVLIFGVLLLANEHGGGLGKMFRAKLQQPRHRVACDAIERWSGAEVTHTAAHHTVIATLRNAAGAQQRFAALRPQLPATASLTRVGDSLLLTLPAADDAARERWFAEFQSSDTNAFVALTNRGVSMTVTFTAPSAAAGTNLANELREYLMAAHLGDLVPPWSPQAFGPEYETARAARRTWHRIGTNINARGEAPAVLALYREVAAAGKRGAKSELAQLATRQIELRRQEETAIYERLRGAGTDPELLALHAQLGALGYTNHTARAALEQRISLQLGPVATNLNAAEISMASLGATTGVASRRSLVVEIRWLGFKEPAAGLPALIDWICSRGGRQIHYGIASTGDELDDLEE